MDDLYKLYLQTKDNVRRFGNTYGDVNTLKILEAELGIPSENILDKILKAIDSVETYNDEEMLMKLEIEYLIMKMYFTPGVREENLRILDEYSSNGSKANYQKKFTRTWKPDEKV